MGRQREEERGKEVGEERVIGRESGGGNEVTWRDRMGGIVIGMTACNGYSVVVVTEVRHNSHSCSMKPHSLGLEVSVVPPSLPWFTPLHC